MRVFSIDEATDLREQLQLAKEREKIPGSNFAWEHSSDPFKGGIDWRSALWFVKCREYYLTQRARDQCCENWGITVSFSQRPPKLMLYVHYRGKRKRRQIPRATAAWVVEIAERMELELSERKRGGTHGSMSSGHITSGSSKKQEGVRGEHKD